MTAAPLVPALPCEETFAVPPLLVLPHAAAPAMTMAAMAVVLVAARMPSPRREWLPGSAARDGDAAVGGRAVECGGHRSVATEPGEQSGDQLVVDTAHERWGDVDDRAERAVAQPQAAFVTAGGLVAEIGEHARCRVERCRGGQAATRAAVAADLLSLVAGRAHGSLGRVCTGRLDDRAGEDAGGDVVTPGRQLQVDVDRCRSVALR